MIPVICGPTAVGKSGLAIAVAERLTARGRPCEIVNLDSMLVYRGMDIGTAKPDAAEQARVRHHLIDIWELTRTATVADFQRLARDVIAERQAAGVIPILAGGSSLYTHAVTDHLEFPGTDPAVRAELEARLAEIGPDRLHRELAAVDPAAAATIPAGNARRTVRALEVIRLTGAPYAAALPEHVHALPGVVQIGLDGPRDWLDRRIELRVARMWEAGLVDEVRGLVPLGLREGRTASKALGYRQVLDFLAGEISEAEARDRTVVVTRRFARKQGGWHRRDPRTRWFDARDDDLLEQVLAHLGPRD